MNSDDRLTDMMTRLRPMAVLHDGIWQAGEGTWLDVGNYKAKVFLRGMEIVCDSKHFLDLDGYGPKDIALEITRRNISTLPKATKRVKTHPDPIPRAPRPANEPPLQPYRVVSRGGRPHALPYPRYQEELPPEPPHQIVVDPPAAEEPPRND